MDGLESSYTPILTGHLWALPKPGPWGGHEEPVTIIDVREGWVRYGHGVDSDLRRTEESFRAMYQWVGEKESA